MKQAAAQDRPQKSATSSRWFNGIAGTFYAFSVLLIYAELSKSWAYLGYWYANVDTSVNFMSIAAAGSLGLLMPIERRSTSAFCIHVLYYLLFIPALIIPVQQGALANRDIILLEVSIWVSAAAMAVLLRDGKPFKEIRITQRFFWACVLASWFLSHMLITYVFWGSMSIVGIDRVYEQRSEAAVVTGSGIVYVMGFMSGAVNPFILVMGIRNRNAILIALAILGQLIIYSTLAAKIVVVSSFVVVAVYYLFNRDLLNYIIFNLAVIALAAGGLITYSLQISGLSALASIADVIYMRTVTLPGVAVGVYSNFFVQYPVTYLSHSLAGRAFTDYPYGDESVGQVIGRFVTPGLGNANNFNANFIAADAIAGFGLYGVTFIFLLVAILIWLTSKIVGHKDRAVICASISPFIFSLADSSLFTAVLTGGGAGVALVLYGYRCSQSTGNGIGNGAHPSSRRWAGPAS